jgi:hypothetical protein
VIVKVMIEDRIGEETRVYSDELPGLILAGRDRSKLLAAIEPAVRALLQHKGIDCSKLRIDATFVLPSVPPTNQGVGK